jgi:hypothetical protein
MNKKILGIIAGIATVGSAVFAAPAHAVTQDVDLEVSIQPSVYLRTFQTIQLQITQGDLGAAKEKDFNATPITDGTTALTLTRPTLGQGANTTVTKNVKELFAVWSNSGKPVNVTVTPVANNAAGTLLTNPADATSKIKLLTPVVITPGTGASNGGTPTSAVPITGGVDLTFDVIDAQAGLHSGAKLTVEALAQL